MSRLFNDANSEYLVVDSTPVTGPPFTMAAWANYDATNPPNSHLWLGDKDALSEYWVLCTYNLQVWLWAVTAGGNNKAVASLNPGGNVWYHACGIEYASNSRAVFMNGANKGTNSTDLSPANADRLSIGVRGDSTPSGYMSGLLAEIALWNTDLTDAEVAILADGFSPLFVRPANLVAYWPLIGRYSPEIDLVGGYGMTLNSGDSGPVAAAHPRIIYPSSPQVFAFAAAAAGLSPAVAAYYYRMMRTGGC